IVVVGGRQRLLERLGRRRSRADEDAREHRSRQSPAPNSPTTHTLNPNPSTGILPVEYRIPNVAGNSSGPGHAGKPAGIRKAWIPGQRGRKATVFSSFRSEDEALRRLKPRQWRNSGVEQRTDA